MEQEGNAVQKKEVPLFSYLTHQLWPVFISVHQKSRNNEFCLSGSLVVGCLDALINLDLLEVKWELKFTNNPRNRANFFSHTVLVMSENETKQTKNIWTKK